MNTSKAIDHICQYLPYGWGIRIDLENGYGGVVVVRPDHSEVSMSEPEADIEEQLRNALKLAIDEEDFNRTHDTK